MKFVANFFKLLVGNPSVCLLQNAPDFIMKAVQVSQPFQNLTIITKLDITSCCCNHISRNNLSIAQMRFNFPQGKFLLCNLIIFTVYSLSKYEILLTITLWGLFLISFFFLSLLFDLKISSLKRKFFLKKNLASIYYDIK